MIQGEMKKSPIPRPPTKPAPTAAQPMPTTTATAQAATQAPRVPSRPIVEELPDDYDETADQKAAL